MNVPRRLTGGIRPASPSTPDRLRRRVIAIGLTIIVQSVYRLGDVANPLGWIALGSLAIVAASFALEATGSPGLPLHLGHLLHHIRAALRAGAGDRHHRDRQLRRVAPAPEQPQAAVVQYDEPGDCALGGAQVYSLLSHQHAALDAHGAGRDDDPGARRVLRRCTSCSIPACWPTAVALSKGVSVIRGLARAFRDHLAELFRRRVGGVLPDRPDALRGPARCCRGRCP